MDCVRSDAKLRDRLREVKVNHSGEWVDSSYLMRLIEELMNKDLEPGEETEGECA